jgi:hypothetical protein
LEFKKLLSEFNKGLRIVFNEVMYGHGVVRMKLQVFLRIKLAVRVDVPNFLATRRMYITSPLSVASIAISSTKLIV